jgi:hypothetical protein
LCLQFVHSRLLLFRSSFPPHLLQPCHAATCYNFVWRTLTQAVDVFVGRSYMGALSPPLLPPTRTSNMHPTVAACLSQFLQECAQHLAPLSPPSPTHASPSSTSAIVDDVPPEAAAAAAAAEEVVPSTPPPHKHFPTPSRLSFRSFMLP